jgi:hypothetical protein
MLLKQKLDLAYPLPHQYQNLQTSKEKVVLPYLGSSASK